MRRPGRVVELVTSAGALSEGPVGAFADPTTALWVHVGREDVPAISSTATGSCGWVRQLIVRERLRLVVDLRLASSAPLRAGARAGLIIEASSVATSVAG